MIWLVLLRFPAVGLTPFPPGAGSALGGIIRQCQPFICASRRPIPDPDQMSPDGLKDWAVLYIGAYTIMAKAWGNPIALGLGQRVIVDDLQLNPFFNRDSARISYSNGVCYQSLDRPTGATSSPTAPPSGWRSAAFQYNQTVHF